MALSISGSVEQSLHCTPVPVSISDTESASESAILEKDRSVRDYADGKDCKSADDKSEFVAQVEEVAGDSRTYDPGSKDDPHRRYRIGKQTMLVGTWICIGLATAMIGSTLPDLKDRLGVNYEEVAQVLMAKSIGALVGTVVAGFLLERLYSWTELFVGLGLLLFAAGTACIPHGRYLAVTAGLFSACGFAEGFISTGGNTMVMHMWGINSAAPMHSLHFGFGVGALIAPQIAKPFLSADAISDAVTAGPLSTTSYQNSTEAPPGSKSRIEVPYAIIGVLIACFSVVVLIYHFKGIPKGVIVHRPTTKFKAMLNPKICGKGHLGYGIELLVCLFIYYIQCVGGESVMTKFLFSFATESEVQFSKTEASNLQTAFWASFTFGRLLGIPLARFVSLPVIIAVDCVGLIGVTIVMAILAYNTAIILWVFSCLMGAFIALVYPNGMAWADLYLVMNSIGVMVLGVGSYCGGFIYEYLIGYLFERAPRNLMYVMVGYAVGLTIVFLVMQTLVTIHRRSLTETHEVPNPGEPAYIEVSTANNKETSERL